MEIGGDLRGRVFCVTLHQCLQAQIGKLNQPNHQEKNMQITLSFPDGLLQRLL